MSRTMEARLRKPEERRAAAWPRRSHSIIGDTTEELAAKRRALTATPAWSDGDGIIERLIVDPPHRIAA